LVETNITSAAIDVDNGLSPEQFAAATTLGKDTADREIDAGADLLIPADLAVANTTVAAAVMGVLSRTEPVAIVGPGSGTTDAMFRARHVATDAQELLQVIGNADLAAEAALIAQAATRRTPVLVSGMFTAVAAVLAERLAPGTHAWCYAADITAEPAHVLALQ